MSSKLFDAWTWSRKLPAPFEHIGSSPHNDIQSKYNKTRAAKSTLHAATLSGIFAYMVHIPPPQSTLNRSRRAPKPRRLCTATADIVHRKSTHKQTPAETFPPQERREAQA